MDNKLLLLQTIKTSDFLPDEAKINLLEKLPYFTDQETKIVTDLLNWEIKIAREKKDNILRNILILIKELEDDF